MEFHPPSVLLSLRDYAVTVQKDKINVISTTRTAGKAWLDLATASNVTLVSGREVTVKKHSVVTDPGLK